MTCSRQKISQTLEENWWLSEYIRDTKNLSTYLPKAKFVKDGNTCCFGGSYSGILESNLFLI